MSSVAVRQNVWTGVTQRRHSSTPPGTSDVSETRAARAGRVLVQHRSGPRQQGPRRLVPRHEQRQEEHEQFLLAERAPTDFAAHEERDQILPRAVAGFDWMCATREIRRARRAPPWSRRGGGRATRWPRSGPAAKVLPVRLVDPQQLRDHGQREGCRQLGDEIDLVPRIDGVEQRRGTGADGVGEARHGPRREPSVDQPTEGGVLGRVHVQDRATLHRRPARTERVIDQRTVSGAEVTRVTAQVPDVLVAADGPESRRALVHRILGTELGPARRSSRPGGRRRRHAVDPAPLVLEHGPSDRAAPSALPSTKTRGSAAAHLQPSSAEADSRRASRMSPIGFTRSAWCAGDALVAVVDGQGPDQREDLVPGEIADLVPAAPLVALQ